MQLQRKYIIIIALLIACLAFLFWPKSEKHQFVRVQKGLFRTTITEKGEIKANVAEDILAPHTNIKNGRYLPPMEIIELVPEGTLVKRGDKVAVLDPSQIMQVMSNIEMRSYGITQQIEQSRLDSSLSLTEARSAIEKIKEQLTDAHLRVEQSIYESKSVQRQEQIALEKIQRQLNSEIRNYDQKERSFKAQIAREQGYITRYLNQADGYKKLMQQTIVKAPSEGMVIYADKFGIKTKVGSNVSGWQPVIATLPDLRYMNSIIMVKETDISKIKIGQKVELTVEALPGRSFTGEVVKIANIGQELANQFQIAFRVEIKVEVPQKEEPFELLPNMTSTNTIITKEWPDVLFIDKKVVHHDGSDKYVYLRKGGTIKKRIITTGAENEEFVIIEDGLDVGDKVVIESYE